MTDRELRKLRRAELLEMLIESEQINERLKEEVEVLRQQVTEREMKIDRAGSLAEAALQLSGIFEAAQDAADRYLENIRIRSGIRTPAKCDAIQDRVQEKNEEIDG